MPKAINKIILLIITVSLLTSCAAISTLVSKKKLDVQTKVSNSIFLNINDDKTLFIQIHNTSDQQDLSIEDDVKKQLINKGYHLIENSTQAHYLLQINILQSGKTSKIALEKSPFGTLDAIGFGAAGALIGGRTGKLAGTIIGAAVGAAGAVVADSLVEDVYYLITTDVRVTEQYFDHKIPYQTRITNSANQVNLKWSDAKPALEKSLVTSIVGVF